MCGCFVLQDNCKLVTGRLYFTAGNVYELACLLWKLIDCLPVGKPQKPLF